MVVRERGALARFHQAALWGLLLKMPEGESIVAFTPHVVNGELVLTIQGFTFPASYGV